MRQNRRTLLCLCVAAIIASAQPSPYFLNDQLGIMLQLDNMLPASNVFGSRAWQVDRQFQLISRAGAKWSRAGIGWEQIEAQQGQCQWAAADTIVQAAHNNGVNLVWLLGNTAPWDSSNGQWNGIPKDLSDPNGYFPQFVQQLVTRYKQNIHYWEIHNEPNLDYEWVTTSPDQYADYLIRANTIIKAADPSATVVFGGLGGSVPQQTTWLKRAIASVRSKTSTLPFDILNFHVYAGDAGAYGFHGKNAISQYLASCNSQIQAALAASGVAGLPVWFTEFDYPADPSLQPDDPDYGGGAAGQSALVANLFSQLVVNHPERKIFWASLLDDYDDDGFQSMGLVQSNSNHDIRGPHPSFYALQTLLASPALEPPPGAATRITGWLRTEGSRVVDMQGHPVRLLGVDNSGLEWGAGKAWQLGHNPACADTTDGCWAPPEQQTGAEWAYDDIFAWGFNSVRLLVSWANLEPSPPTRDSSGAIVHKWNSDYLAAVDNTIRQFQSRGIPVILSLHQWAWSPAFVDPTSGAHGLGMPPWLYVGTSVTTQSAAVDAFFHDSTQILAGYNVQEGYVDAWKFLIARYAGNPEVVGADLFNEPPGNGTTYNLKAFYEKVGSAVSALNPNLLLITQDAVDALFKLEGKPNLPNAVYSFHMYPRGWTIAGFNGLTGQQMVQSHWDKATSWNMPMWIGELGRFGCAAADPDWTTQMQQGMDYTRQQGISWAFFAYQHSTCPLENSGQTDTATIQFLYGSLDPGVVLNVDAASYDTRGAAPGSIVSAFGAGLSNAPLGAASSSLPVNIAGTSVSVVDSAGVERQAPLYFVAPGQVNFLVPDGTAPGPAIVEISRDNSPAANGPLRIDATHPGLFTVDGILPSGQIFRVKSSGSQSVEPVTPAPIDLGAAGDQVYLLLYGTGIRNRADLSAVTATIGGVSVPVSYAGAQGQYPGLDQVNVMLPKTLAGRGTVDVVLLVSGSPANRVTIAIR